MTAHLQTVRAGNVPQGIRPRVHLVLVVPRPRTDVDAPPALGEAEIGDTVRTMCGKDRGDPQPRKLEGTVQGNVYLVGRHVEIELVERLVTNGIGQLGDQ